MGGRVRQGRDRSERKATRVQAIGIERAASGCTGEVMMIMKRTTLSHCLKSR